MHKNFEILERINKINNLICSQQTGNSYDFAERLNIGRRQLFNILEELRIIGAPIKYCKKRETFYYEDDFDLKINYSLKIIKNGKTNKIW